MSRRMCRHRAAACAETQKVLKKLCQPLDLRRPGGYDREYQKQPKLFLAAEAVFEVHSAKVLRRTWARMSVLPMQRGPPPGTRRAASGPGSPPRLPPLSAGANPRRAGPLQPFERRRFCAAQFGWNRGAFIASSRDCIKQAGWGVFLLEAGAKHPAGGYGYDQS